MCQDELTYAASNEGYETDAAAVNAVDRASVNDDITLCENTLYAQSPEPLLVPGISPLQDNGRPTRMFILLHFTEHFFTSNQNSWHSVTILL